MIVIPICLRCSHCREGMVCDSYPDRIPKEILLGEKKPEETCKSFKNNEKQ